MMTGGPVVHGGTLFACAVATLALVTACHGDGPVVIGVAASGTFLDAVRLAVEEAKAAGPLPSFDTLVIEEGTNEAGPAIRSAAEFVSTPGIVAVLGHTNSAASLAAAPFYNDAEIVQLAPTSTAPFYSAAGPFSFRMVPPDDRQGEFLRGLVAERFPDGVRLAVLYVNDDYGRALRRAFGGRLDQERYPIVLELPHAEGELGRSGAEHAAEAIDAVRPGMLVWLSRGSNLRRLLPRLRDRNVAIPILGSDATASAAPAPRDLDGWTGLDYVEFFRLDGTADLRAFRARFERRFGVAPRGPEILTYEAMRVLLEGLRSGARTGPEMADFLRSLGRERPPYGGLAGPVQFDEKGDLNRPYALETVRGRRQR